MKKLILLLSILSFIGNAQNGFTSYPCALTGPITYFYNRTSLTIDNAGNKWVGFKRLSGSAYSLLKFDNTNWTNYTSIINASVLALESDASGNVWIGTLNEGLIKYDGSTFTSYTRANSSIISDTITSLSFINNKLYIGSYNGFSELNGPSFINFNRSNSGISSDSVFCFKKEGSQIWIGTHKGLNTYNGTNTINYIGSNDTINAIEIDAVGNKWLGTNSNGLVQFNNSSFVNISTLIPSVFGGAIPSKIISITTSQAGNIIVNSEKKLNNLTTVANVNSLVEIFPNNTYKLYFLSTNRVVANCLFKKDASGKIYFINSRIQTGTSPSLIDPKTFLFSFDETQYNVANVISSITPENTEFLDINEVKAGCNPNSDIHWDGSKGLYEVPKGSGTSPVWNTHLWIGGYIGSDLRVAANTYRQSGLDFWPGTISTITNDADSINAAYYNRVWKVNKFDVENFKYNFLNGNVQNGSYTIPDVILNWPWRAYDDLQLLAPFVDFNNDLWYDPMDGDYPLIKGDQMLWWVFNDTHSTHLESGSPNKIKIQVMASAYAYICPTVADSDKVINYTTFYNYKIVNRGNDTLDSTFVTLGSDVDLGFYNDDYIGCDVQNNFSYVYNGDNYDEDFTLNGIPKNGYNSNTPYFSCNILKGGIADQNDGKDNDKDGCTDCSFPINPLTGEPDPFGVPIDENTLPEHTSMSKFTYYNNDFSFMGNPSALKHYYNYMTGSWKNDSRVRYDNAAGTSTVTTMPICDYVFPGKSDLAIGYGIGGTPTAPVTTTTEWSELTAFNSPGDRRMLTGTGDFTLYPGQTQEFDFAYVFTQDSVALANGVLYDKVVSDNKKIKKWFRDNNAPSCLDLSGVGLKEQHNQIKMNVYPNPANNVLNVDAGNNNTITGIKVMDILGKEISTQTKLNRSSETLNISSLQSGVYLLHVTTEKGIYFGKFIKQ